MKNTGFKIIKNFKRASKKILNEFSKIPVSVIGDSMNRTAAISSAILPINQNKFVGTAYTVRVQAGDNLLLYYAIDQAKPGDVIVVDGNGFTERALCGEIMINYAKSRGLAGIIVDGAIRDKIEISQIDFPVYARSATPNGPYKNGPGEINVPVNIGGKIIQPGDILVGDGNGIVVISPEDTKEVLEKAKKILEKEKQMLNDVLNKNQLDLGWVYKKLKDNGCEFVEN